jgi:heat shock protein HtpX
VLVLIALAIMALAYLLAIALRFALSRKREFIADAGAVELTKDPDALIRALRKVQGHAEMPALPSSVQAMLLDSPEETLGNAWLATHPDLAERIAALVRYAGRAGCGARTRRGPGPGQAARGRRRPPRRDRSLVAPGLSRAQPSFSSRRRSLRTALSGVVKAGGRRRSPPPPPGRRGPG